MRLVKTPDQPPVKMYLSPVPLFRTLFDSYIELPKVRIELNTERDSKERYIGDNLMLEALVAKYKEEKLSDAGIIRVRNDSIKTLQESLNKTEDIIPYVVGGGVIVGILLGVTTVLFVGG